MNDKLVREINKQTHPPPQDQAEVTKIKASIKRRSQAAHGAPPSPLPPPPPASQQMWKLPFRTFQKQLLSTCRKLTT